jgi:tetratricopeptide (TPR) repeat protein
MKGDPGPAASVSRGPFRLGAFDVHRPLARGGMGEVWVGAHRATRLRVAVKVVPDDGTPAEVASFRDEIRAVAALDHPHVVWVHDRGEVDDETARAAGVSRGSPWLAMDLVEGGDLKQRAAGLDWAGVRGLLDGLLDALAHAHGRGILHRDLKPGNVLFDPTTETWKLADFGMAHVLGSDARPVPGGTLHYASPEQLSASGDDGPWTDLYALGALTWTVVTGAPPFAGKGEELVAAHLTRPLPRFAARFPVPPGLEGWLRWCLAKRPVDRLQCAADAKAALSELPGALGAWGAGAVAGGDEDTVRWDLSKSRSGLRPPVAVVGAAAPGHVRPPVAAFPLDWRRANVRPAPAELRNVGVQLLALREPGLFGREPLQDRLWALLAEATRTGRIVGAELAGPPGVGRTWLGRWLLTRAAELGAAVPVRREPGRPWSRALRHGGVPESGPGRAAWAAHAGLTTGDLEALERIDHDPQAIVTVARTLRGLARERAVVVLLDDADADSAALWRHLADHPDPFPALVVAVGELGGPPRERLVVDPLPTEAVVSIVDGLLPVEPGLANRLAAWSGGRPGVAVEGLRSLAAAGDLEAGPHGWRLRAGLPFRPLSADAALAARLWAVVAGDGVRSDAIGVAALAGPWIDRDEWARACGGSLPDGLLAALVSAGLGASDGPRFVFAHPALPDHVSARLSSADTTRLLGQLAAAVREPARRAAHLRRAGRSNEALVAIREALTFEEGLSTASIPVAENALELLALTGTAPSDPLWFQARLLRANALVVRRDAAAARAALDEAVAAAATTVVPNAWARIYLMEGILAILASDFAAAGVALDRAEHEALLCGDTISLVRSRTQQGRLALTRGDAIEAIERLSAAVDAMGTTPVPELDGVVRYQLSHALLSAGRFDEALREGEAALRSLRRTGSRMELGTAANTLGDLERRLGNLDRAEAWYAAATEVFRALGHPYEGVVAVGRCLVACRRGQWAEGLAHALLAIDRLRRGSNVGLTQVAHAAACWPLARLERWDELALCASEAAQLGDFVDRDVVEATTEAHNVAARAGRPDLARILREIALGQAAALTDREGLPELR